MSLKYILLGMLHEPHSGYDIKKQFERSLGNFWRAELSQIYPLLQKMQGDALVTSKEGASDIGPTRRVYRRTARGSREFRSWLTDGPVVGTERIAYLAQVHFLADLGDDSRAIAFMEELRTYMIDWLHSLESTEEQWRTNDSGYPDELSDDAFYSQLTLEMGLRKVRANVEWCDYAIARIRARSKRMAATHA